MIQAQNIAKHLLIKEIRDNTVVLKNNELRAILIVSSINFALKSADEQEAIIGLYQGFLNSLDFSIQIISVSRKFNIDPYIKSLREKETEQENELLKHQLSQYADFIKGLTEITNIMTESFYVVVPFAKSIIKQPGFFKRLFSQQTKAETKLSDLEFQELKNQLWQRVEFVSSGLRQTGLKSTPLNTSELIELFYRLYNPDASEHPNWLINNDKKTR